MRYLMLCAALAAATISCTAQSAYVYPQQIQQRYFISTGDTDRPYRSLGYIQLTKKGGDIFGFIPVVAADLTSIFGEELTRELERTGADGIINVRFYERQWTIAERLPFLLFFFVPVPTLVELSGELIQFESAAGPPGG